MLALRINQLSKLAAVGSLVALSALGLPTYADRVAAAEIHGGVHPSPAVILQVLKSFDNPEGAVFSADGNHVFVSNSAEAGDL